MFAQSKDLGVATVACAAAAGRARGCSRQQRARTVGGSAADAVGRVFGRVARRASDSSGSRGRCCGFWSDPQTNGATNGLSNMAFDKTSRNKAEFRSRPDFHVSHSGRDQVASGLIMVGK